MMVGRLLSFWDGIFSGAMLNFQGVPQLEFLSSRICHCHNEIFRGFICLKTKCSQLKIDGWKMRFSFKLLPFPENIRSFSGGGTKTVVALLCMRKIIYLVV